MRAFGFLNLVVGIIGLGWLAALHGLTTVPAGATHVDLWATPNTKVLINPSGQVEIGPIGAGGSEGALLSPIRGQVTEVLLGLSGVLCLVCGAALARRPSGSGSG